VLALSTGGGCLCNIPANIFGVFVGDFVGTSILLCVASTRIPK
jgi:hypothetical protein